MNWILEHWTWLLATIPGWAALFYAWKQNRPSRRVEVYTDVPPDQIDIQIRIARAGGVSGPCIYVRFINERGPSVQLEEVGFLSADGTRVKDGGEILGHEVRPGGSATCHFHVESLRNRFQGRPVPAWAYCRDALGGLHKSHPLSHEIRSALVSTMSFHAPLTPHPTCVILHLPVAEVGDSGGGEDRCLFVSG